MYLNGVHRDVTSHTHPRPQSDQCVTQKTVKSLNVADCGFVCNVLVLRTFIAVTQSVLPDVQGLNVKPTSNTYTARSSEQTIIQVSHFLLGCDM
jgi:hypothetical protein